MQSLRAMTGRAITGLLVVGLRPIMLGSQSIGSRGRTSLVAPIWVYNNWSTDDELSDAAPLTRELAMRELRQLRQAGARRFDDRTAAQQRSLGRCTSVQFAPGCIERVDGIAC